MPSNTMHRRRGVTVPDALKTSDRLATKKELALRTTAPTCPGVPIKLRKNILKKKKKPLSSLPNAIWFLTEVPLSFLYDPKRATKYIDQVFTRIGIVGEGSFGIVYKVRSRADQELYAIKRAKPHINEQDCFAEILNNEKVGIHQNIVRYYLGWQEWSEFYLQLELCEMSLSTMCKLEHEIPEEMCWNVLYDMCHALSHMHDRGLIHLDVKPGNIMIKRGIFKLGDFGLVVDLKKIPEPSRNKADLTNEEKREVRKCLSTLSDGDGKYLATEVLDSIYTTSCDIFGLGITVMECVADLQLPDYGPLWQQIRHGILPKEFVSKATLGMQVLIERMTHIKVSERPSAKKILTYQSMRDVAKNDMKYGRTDFTAPYLHRLVMIPPFVDYCDEVIISKHPGANPTGPRRSLQFLDE